MPPCAVFTSILNYKNSINRFSCRAHTNNPFFIPNGFASMYTTHTYTVYMCLKLSLLRLILETLICVNTNHLERSDKIEERRHWGEASSVSGYSKSSEGFPKNLLLYFQVVVSALTLTNTA